MFIAMNWAMSSASGREPIPRPPSLRSAHTSIPSSRRTRRSSFAATATSFTARVSPTTPPALPRCWRSPVRWQAGECCQHGAAIVHRRRRRGGRRRSAWHAATSIQQPRWSATIASLIVVDGAGTDTIIAEGLGQPPLRGHGARTGRTFLERLRRRQSYCCPGAHDRPLHANAGSGLAQDHLQRRHHSRRNVGELHSARSATHARRYAFGFGGRTGSPGASAA